MDTNMVKNRVAFIISMTIICIAAVSLFIIGYLSFVPVNIVKANTQPYTVVTPVVAAGDNMIYIANVCKFKETSSIATRVFVDENNVHYPLPTIASNIPVGCAKNKVVVPTLPTYRPGKWYVTLDIEYQVNPLRRQTYHFRTQTFTIIKPVIAGVQ